MLSSKVSAKQLSNPSYVQDSTLWHKEKHFYGFSQHELSAKRHPFLKMGKILGLETRRFIAQWQGHLFYFDVLKVQCRVNRSPQITLVSATSRMSMSSGSASARVDTSSCSQMDLKAAFSTLINPLFGSRRKNKLPSTVCNLISPKSILFRVSSAQAASLR